MTLSGRGCVLPQRKHDVSIPGCCRAADGESHVPERTSQLLTGREGRHLAAQFLDNVPASELCEEDKIPVSTFYIWQKKMVEGALGKGKAHVSGLGRDLERKVSALGAKLSQNDAVIAEVTQEYVAPKECLGED